MNMRKWDSPAMRDRVFFKEACRARVAYLKE